MNPVDKKNKSKILFGINPVLEKLKASPQEVSEVIIADGPQRSALRSVDATARRLGRRVTYLQTRALDRLAAGQRHQGVLARVDAYTYYPLAELLQSTLSLAEPVWVLLLDGLTDPGNFGALLRSAEAAGVRHVVIPKDRSVVVTPAVVKASAGAAHHVNICRETNLRRVILELKERGFWIVGLDAQARERIHERIYPGKLGIVLGSEGSGIRPLIMKECDFLVSVPMQGRLGSLNVGVSGAIFFYELLRQRNQG